jgi:flagellar hook protein FlgE
VVGGKTTSVPATQTTGSPADIPISVQFPGTGSNVLTQSINLNLGQFGANEGAVAGQGLVQTNATGTTSQIAVGALTQDGYPAGSFQSVAIDSNGYVNVSYSNGVTQPYFQIPIANFPASIQLQRLDGGAYKSTLASGNPVINQPGQNGAGTLDPSALENSTVDIAGQFTQLITAQQAYTANSKVITTVDTLLSAVINLVQ